MFMIKRCFIAVDLPRVVKEKLREEQEELKNLFEGEAVKWVKEENLHITLLFLGVVKDEKEIIENLKKIKASSFSVKIKELSYFPKDKKEAKMIWAVVDSEGLKSLAKKIGGSSEITPHITIGRVRRWEWQKVSLGLIPDIQEPLDVNFKVDSFFLIESKTRRSGPDYDIIEEFKLEK
jgi:RNA 2',3'-cyclic 3'-phosphodiesterase